MHLGQTYPYPLPSSSSPVSLTHHCFSLTLPPQALINWLVNHQRPQMSRLFGHVGESETCRYLVSGQTLEAILVPEGHAAIGAIQIRVDHTATWGHAGF